MQKFIRVDNIEKIIVSGVNSRAISVYFSLHLMATMADDSYQIYDFNPHKLMVFMKARNIETCYQQIVNSIFELQEADLIKLYVPNEKYIFTDCIDNKRLSIIDSFIEEDYVTSKYEYRDIPNNPLDIEEHTKQYAYIHMPRLLTENEFYKMNIREKRMMLWLLKHFAYNPEKLSSKTARFNLRKPSNQDYFKKHMYLYSDPMIMDTLNGLSTFFRQRRISGLKQKALVYDFSILPRYIEDFDKELITKEDLNNYDGTLLAKALILFENYNRKISGKNLFEIVKTLFGVGKKHVRKILENYIFYNVNGVEKSFNAFFTISAGRYFNDWNYWEFVK